MKKTVIGVLFVLLAITFGGQEAEAQYASGYHGIPAAPGYGNGYARHVNNGYVGVNWRHHSPYPMKWGTHPGWYGGTVVYPGYRPGYGYGRPGYPYVGPGYRGGCVNPGNVRVYVQGTYIGNGVVAQGAVEVQR